MHTWLALLLLLAPSSSHLTAESAKHASAKAPDEAPPRAPVRGRVTLVESETVQTGAPFDGALMSRLVHIRSMALRACYERDLIAVNAPFEGRIVVSLTVTPEGLMSNVRIDSNGTGNDMTASCTMGVIRGFRFNPGPEGEVHFTLTFEFRPE
jgi:TonB family protein